jgi:hypothetical protein
MKITHNFQITKINLLTSVNYFASRFEVPTTGCVNPENH